jgi:tetratricopeptide (TPR) repeat protein
VGIVNEQSEHLSSAQIENYGDRPSGAGLDANHKAEWVEAHLDGCPDCRSRLLDFQRIQLGLVAGSNQPTDRTVNTASTPDCPSQDALRQLATGLLANDVAHKLTNHAATCDHCGPLLRVHTEDFSNDFSPQEQAVLAKLQSSSAEWQRKTAQEMIFAATAVNAPVISANQDASFTRENATTAKENPSPGDNTGGAKKNPSPTSEDAGTTSLTAGTATSLPKKSSADGARKPFFWKWALIPGYAVVTAAIFLIISLGTIGIWYARRDTPEKVEKLLAQAVTDVRTMDTRWPGASYSTVKSSRGASYPANLPLLEAQQIVDRHPGQQQWLLEDASVVLLQRRPDAAIQMLSLETVDSICDRCTLVLAIAEIAAGDSTGVGKNYEAALKLINSISSNSSEYNIAIYNRAVVYERLGKVDEAITDWRTVLKTEKDNGWVSEANQRLADLVARKSK